VSRERHSATSSSSCNSVSPRRLKITPFSNCSAYRILERDRGLSTKMDGLMKNRFRSFRKRKNWSQRELADRAGVSPPCIDAIERERFLRSVQLAYDLAAAFERSVTEVFLRGEPRVGPSQKAKSEPPADMTPAESSHSPCPNESHEP